METPGVVPVGLLGTSTSIAETLDMAVLADGLGFDGFFLPEHHQEPYWPSAPLITLAAAAGRTRRIRLGTAVSVMALHNPARLAEEMATLDVISGGRAVLGVGLGYQERDFAALGVDGRERLSLMTEGLEVMRLAWGECPFTFEGRRFHFRDVTIHPKPVQRPHPPIWLAAWSRDGARRAGRIGDGWLTDPIHGLDAICGLAAEYRQAAREAGRPACVVLMRQFALGRSEQEAAELYTGAVAAVWQYYWRNHSFNLALEPQWREVEDPGTITGRVVIPRRVPFGSPDQCLEHFREWIDALRPDYIIAVPTFSTRGAALLQEEVRLFAQSVLPRLTGAG